MSWIQLTKETRWFLWWDKKIYLLCWSIVKRKKGKWHGTQPLWRWHELQITIKLQKIGTLCRCWAHQMYISRSIGHLHCLHSTKLEIAVGLCGHQNAGPEKLALYPHRTSMNLSGCSAIPIE
jgi:uncharacterized membrane protein YhdT